MVGLHSQITRLSWLLLLATANTTVSGLDISPATAADSSSINSTESSNAAMTAYAIDVTGMLDLSDSPTRFYGVTEIQVQLAADMPVWTLQKDRFSRMTPDMFYGASEDGTIGCSLFRYQSILTGSVTDRVNQLTYEINHGQTPASYLTTAIPQELIPEPADPPVLSADELVIEANMNNDSSLILNQDAMVCTTEDNCSSETDLTAVTWDVAIVYTESAECHRSNLGATSPSGCTRTAATKLQVEADISMAVAEAQMAHANSDTGVTINVVALEADYNYLEADILQALTDLRQPGDGKLDGILATR